MVIGGTNYWFLCKSSTHPELVFIPSVLILILSLNLVFLTMLDSFPFFLVTASFPWFKLVIIIV